MTIQRNLVFRDELLEQIRKHLADTPAATPAQTYTVLVAAIDADTVNPIPKAQRLSILDQVMPKVYSADKSFIVRTFPDYILRKQAAPSYLQQVGGGQEPFSLKEEPAPVVKKKKKAKEPV